MRTWSAIGSADRPDMAEAPHRILITGASGFVGRHLTTALGATYPSTALLTPSIDVRDQGMVAAAVQEAVPDVCIHLAAVSTVRGAERDEDQAWQVNLRGTLHMARAILRHAPDCLGKRRRRSPPGHATGWSPPGR